MVEPLISISLLGYIISTDIAENLSRSQIQKQGMDMLDKFIRIQTTDASIIDDIGDTSTPSKLTKGKKLHERGDNEEHLPLDDDLI